MHTLQLLAHEASLLQAGATVLIRPAVEIKDVMELKTLGGGAAHMSLGSSIRGWEDSPFPPVGTACEYLWTTDAPNHARRFGATQQARLLRFRIAGLGVKRVKDHDFPSHLLAVPNPYDDGREIEFYDWWTATFPSHDFDSAWAWVATLEKLT